MATWGGSTQCHLEDDDDDDYSEVGVDDDDEDEHDEGEESSSSDDMHACSARKQRNYSRNSKDGYVNITHSLSIGQTRPVLVILHFRFL